MGVFTYRSMHPTIDAVADRETDRLDGGDVVRFHTPTPLSSLVGDLGALVEALEAAAGYARMLHEDVLATLVGGDEAVAFIVVEPLYRSLGHLWSPPFFTGAPPQQKAAPLTLRAALLTHHKTHIYLLHPYYTTTKGRSPDKEPWPGLGS